MILFLEVGSGEVLLAVVSGLVYEVGVPGGAPLPAELARVAGVALHMFRLHVVLHPLPRVASMCVCWLNTWGPGILVINRLNFVI